VTGGAYGDASACIPLGAEQTHSNNAAVTLVSQPVSTCTRHFPYVSMPVSKHGRPFDSPKLIVINRRSAELPCLFQLQLQLCKLFHNLRNQTRPRIPGLSHSLQILFEADSATRQTGFPIAMSTVTDLGGCTVQIVAPPMRIHRPFFSGRAAPR